MSGHLQPSQQHSVESYVLWNAAVCHLACSKHRYRAYYKQLTVQQWAIPNAICKILIGQIFSKSRSIY